MLEPAVFELIEGDQSSWESTPLVGRAANGDLHAFQHRGFRQAMDTLRDKNQLEDLWETGDPPWKVLG